MADPVATNPDADGLVGAITAYAGETLPGPKYRWCHGTQTLLRTEFSLLFSRLGESWGAGDGSTTFGLPDLDGRVVVGFKEADADFDAVGGTGGTKDATMPSHSHTISPSSHSHSGGADIAVANPGAGTAIGVSSTIASSQTGGTSLTIGSAGGSGDNMPPFATVRYIIKVA
jgi:microcystin-dependent protein